MIFRSRSHTPDWELEALARELRAVGVGEPNLQPSPARRAKLRVAVLAAGAARSRRGAGGLRGAALGIAVAAGGGLVIASAAGGGNPAGRVIEAVKDISAPVIVATVKESPRSGERPVEAKAPAVAAPQGGESRPAPVETRPAAAETREDPTREPVRPTATPTPGTRPVVVAANDVTATPVAMRPPDNSVTNVRPEDTETKTTPITNADAAPVRTPTPTATPTTFADPKNETDTSVSPFIVPATRTPEPTPTPTPQPEHEEDAGADPVADSTGDTTRSSRN